jgi:anaerobic ribonucleoside-triphosphate reductase activating protein
MNINIHSFVDYSLVDGPGARAVVFFQGCSLACPGCQNQHLWPADAGRRLSVFAVASQLVHDSIFSNSHGNVTITGGEPFQQPAELAELVYRLRSFGVKNILVYTGYTWEELVDPSHPAGPWMKAILAYIDVLVDGRFEQGRDDPLIAWRGSRNQRPIDVQESICQGHPVILNWDHPEIVLAPCGDAYVPTGLARDLAVLGEIKPTRRCGETFPQSA